MVIHAFPWLSVVFYGYPWISMVIRMYVCTVLSRVRTRLHVPPILTILMVLVYIICRTCTDGFSVFSSCSVFQSTYMYLYVRVCTITLQVLKQYLYVRVCTITLQELKQVCNVKGRDSQGREIVVPARRNSGDRQPSQLRRKPKASPKQNVLLALLTYVYM